MRKNLLRENLLSRVKKQLDENSFRADVLRVTSILYEDKKDNGVSELGSPSQRDDFYDM